MARAVGWSELALRDLSHYQLDACVFQKAIVLVLTTNIRNGLPKRSSSLISGLCGRATNRSVYISHSYHLGSRSGSPLMKRSVLKFATMRY